MGAQRITSGLSSFLPATDLDAKYPINIYTTVVRHNHNGVAILATRERLGSVFMTSIIGQ